MHNDTHLCYPLQEGWVTHWLLAGPHAAALTADAADLAAYQSLICEHHPGATSRIETLPVQLKQYTISEAVFTKDILRTDAFAAGAGVEPNIWNLYTCYEDPFVHLSGDHATPLHLLSWAYIELVSPVEQVVSATLAANGPLDVWHEDAHVHSLRTFTQPIPFETTLRLSLTAGPNRILIRFEQVGYGPTPYLVAMRLSEETGITLRLPSDTRAPDKLQAL
jgi:hypothetical protein